uniref:Uncharacterized protein n=1 Tax=Anguilla anguilla TaxID=7936 RepID=A0A0E9S6M6_ANGAN
MSKCVHTVLLPFESESYFF